MHEERAGQKLVIEHQDVASGTDGRRPGFQAAPTRCRQLGAVLVAARLDRITRRAHTLSPLWAEGISIRAADMLGADDLMMRVYAYAAGDGRLVRWWRGVDFCGSDAGQLVNDWSCDDRRTDRNG
ncbi:recombinase family protein, partial [Pararoseomonas indoligenes]|nr:recombinase family protein [Pararoseomonas indoligenes]